MRQRSRQRTEGEAGFTLLELMVVIAILGIVMRFVLPSLMEDLPDATVQAEARKLAARLSYLRSESRLQSASFGIEFEAMKEGPHRFRIVMPRDKEIIRDSDERWGRDLSDELPLDWTELPEDVVFAGVHVGLQDQDSSQARRVFFDPRGRTAQKVIYLAHRVADPEQTTYSIVVPPLAGPIDVVKGRLEFKTAVDNDF